MAALSTFLSFAAGARFERTACPQCGETLLAPEWSEHVSERCIRHYWTCESCGYGFESSIYLAVPAAEPAR